MLPKALTLAARPPSSNDSDDESDHAASEARKTGNVPLDLPRSGYSHISYVKIYATCRLRRIWFSEGPASQQLPWEFELYSVT
ncbi:hypothetical protein ONZ45_g7852 [Pleurotus djamor]|nr:hypothetical protein ONZ45_g7852 [Pleurotus djamor]